MKYKTKSLSYTFFKIILPIIFAITFLLFYLIIWDVNEDKEAFLENKLIHDSQKQSLIFSRALWNYDKDSTASLMTAMLVDRDIVGISIFDESGSLFESRGIIRNLSYDELDAWLQKNTAPRDPRRFQSDYPLAHLLENKARYIYNTSSISYTSGTNEEFIGFVHIVISDADAMNTLMTNTFKILTTSLIILVLFIFSIAFAYRRSVGIPLKRLKSSIDDAYMTQGGSPEGLTESRNEILYILSAFSRLWKRQMSLESDLRKSREEFKEAINESPVPILIIDVSGDIVLVNSIFTDSYGFDIEDLAQEEDWWRLAFPDAAYRNEITQRWQSLHRENNPHKVTISITDVALTDKSGRMHSIELSISHHEGNVIIAVYDVTARVQIEQEKIRLEAQLNHKNKLDAIGQLAGGIAHDFNNILTGIMSSSQLLERSLENPKKDPRKYINIIQNSAERAADLVEKLLTFSRKKSDTSERYELLGAVNDAYDILQNTINKEIEIIQDIQIPDCYLKGSSTTLINILLNLGINASHAIKGSGEIKILVDRVSLDGQYISKSAFDLLEGDYARVQVEDNGEGIPERIADKIFDPFFTTREDGTGSGLGLSTVYGLIQDNAGEITMTSTPGIGTCFTILLPIDTSAESAPKIPEDVETRIFQGTVLFVDDEETNRELGRDVLQSMGFQIILAEDGKQCLEIFDREKDSIDFIILDMIMPHMSGFDTFLKLKEIDPDCRIIVCSGYADSFELQKLKDMGQNHFLEKPFKIQELQTIIEQILS